MRRLILSVALLACFAAPSQAAQGMNLRWDACMGDGGVLNKNFACDTNVGSEQLVVSFQTDSVFAPVSGVEFSILVRSPLGSINSWWQFKSSGTCRQTALSASAAPLGTPVTCEPLWAGLASGGLTAYGPYTGYGFVDQYRILGVYAVAPSNLVTIAPDIEYFLFRLTLTHAKTVGAGSCEGCTSPVCLGLEYLDFTRPATYNPNRITIATETSPLSSAATWQGSPVVSDFYHREGYYTWQTRDYRVIGCQTTSRSQNRTWGSIKSLYR